MLYIHLDDLGADLLPFRDNIFHFAKGLIGELGDMHQTLNARVQLYKGAKGGRARDLALDKSAFRQTLWQIVPRIGG